MLCEAAGFALALGPAQGPVAPSAWMHSGGRLPYRAVVPALRERLVAAGVALVEQWDEASYVSVKCRDPDGYVVEAFWED